MGPLPPMQPAPEPPLAQPGPQPPMAQPGTPIDPFPGNLPQSNPQAIPQPEPAAEVPGAPGLLEGQGPGPVIPDNQMPGE